MLKDMLNMHSQAAMFPAPLHSQAAMFPAPLHSQAAMFPTPQPKQTHDQSAATISMVAILVDLVNSTSL